MGVAECAEDFFPEKGFVDCLGHEEVDRFRKPRGVPHREAGRVARKDREARDRGDTVFLPRCLGNRHERWQHFTRVDVLQTWFLASFLRRLVAPGKEEAEKPHAASNVKSCAGLVPFKGPLDSSAVGLIASCVVQHCPVPGQRRIHEPCC